MQHLPFRLGFALCLTVAIVAADQPAAGTDAREAGDRTVTVERNRRKITITEDESGITVTIVEDGTTTVVEAESALELREKSRRAHALYQRYLRRVRNRVPDADGEPLPGDGVVEAKPLPITIDPGDGVVEAKPLPLPVGPGKIVGPGTIAIGNGITAGNLLEATKAMVAGNRLAWNRGSSSTGTWGSTATGGSVSFRDGGRSVTVSESSRTGITVAVTENGATNAVTARTPEELATKSPEAFRLYQEARKRARISVGAGGHAIGNANGGGNSTASSNGSSSAKAVADGMATGGGSATAIARRRVLVRMLRNARTEQERARIRQMLRQLGQ